MRLAQVFLAVVGVAVSLYTLVVIAAQGPWFLPVFFGDIMAMGWPGQFNLDFLGMLALSALWTAWRNQFTAAGLGLAALAFCFGAPFLCFYLLALSVRCRGDVKAMLVGEARA